MVTLSEIFRWILYTLNAWYRRIAAWILRYDVLLAGSERRFHALLESTPDAMVVVDWHGHIKLLNTQAETLFGRSRADLIGTNAADLLARRFRGHYREQEKRFCRDIEADAPGTGVDLFGQSSSGREFPIEISTGRLKTDSGDFLACTIRDISARKEAEQALRQAEERFRTAFEEAPVGMAVAHLDGTMLEVNHALCEITGRSREDLEHVAGLEAITHMSDRAEDAAERERLIDGSQTRYRAERSFLHASGHAVPVDLSVAVVRNDDGEAQHFLLQVNDITERKQFETRLQHLADHDTLTGMLNRRRFEQELERELARAARYGSAGAVLAIDIDHFKYVNDTLGHSVGDQLIKRVSEIFRVRLRDTDVIARLGGDEFAVLLPEVTPAEAVLAAESLLTSLLEEGRLEMAAGPARRVSASIGVAPFGPASGTGEDILVEADIALYDAKDAGRARVSVFSADADRQGQMQARITWTDRIRDALEDDRFVLYAQPIQALNGDTMPNFELLIRMVDEDGELVPPATFLPIAERTDLIMDLDRWVITRAVALLAQERRAGRPVHLAVNLSAKSVTDPGVSAFIAGELEHAGIDGAGLCFELTETAAIANIDRAKDFAHIISDLGCELSLDDFGSGFASFYYLKHMVFDYVKIDGEFIHDLATSHVNQLVVQSVVDIARGLGKGTIAEFVGDQETMEMLRSYGVDYAQGFHIGKPVPLAEAGLAAATPRPATLLQAA